MLQVTRDVTRSVVSSMGIVAVTICRASDVNTPPVELNATTFTLATSRNDASGLANLSLGAGNVTGVTLPDNFHIDASESVLISVGCIGTCVVIQSHKSSTCIVNHTHATQRWIKMVSDNQTVLNHLNTLCVSWVSISKFLCF